MPFVRNRTGALLSATTAALCLSFSAIVMPVSGDATKPFTGRTAATYQSRLADDPPITSGVCQQEKFALFEGPDSGDITGIDNGCTKAADDLKAAIDAGKKPVTSSAFIYLSELEPFLGRVYQKLPCFLKALKGTQFASATLVIDRSVTLSEPLILPSRFTLAGTGIERNGQPDIHRIGRRRGGHQLRQPGDQHHHPRHFYRSSQRRCECGH